MSDNVMDVASPIYTPNSARAVTDNPSIEHRQLIEAHRALSGLDHAVRFAPKCAGISFKDMVWLLDGLGAAQLDGEPVWVQSVIDDPSHLGVQKAECYADLAAELATASQRPAVSRMTALNIAERLSVTDKSNAVTLRRDANSNETLQHGLAHWEHVVSDDAGASDGLVLAAIADAKFRRLSPFTANNSSSAGLLLGAVLHEEQILEHAPICLSHYFSRHSDQFYAALSDDAATVRFFLRAITETAVDLVHRFGALVKHVEHCQEVIDQTLSRAPVEVVLSAVCRPFCTNSDLMDAGITRRQTSASYLKKLAAAGLLEPHPKGKELRYINPGVLSAFSGLA